MKFWKWYGKIDKIVRWLLGPIWLFLGITGFISEGWKDWTSYTALAAGILFTITAILRTKTDKTKKEETNEIRS